MVNDSAIYSKVGATFATGEEAYQDKNSLYPPELTARVNACYAQMLADGVLLQPISYTWDQATFTLTINKIVTSNEAYGAALTFDTASCVTFSQGAGWTLES